MCLKYLNVIFMCLYFLRNVSYGKSLPTDEFGALANQGEVIFYDESLLKYIIPGSYSTLTSKTDKKDEKQAEELFHEDDENFIILNQHIEAGHIMKTLTFTIYDDNMREAAAALFRIFQTAPVEKINHIKEWAYANINDDIVDYALRVASLRRSDDAIKKLKPPFEQQPYYFINSETINKALKIKDREGKFNSEESQVYQIIKNYNTIAINSNYSGLNEVNDECKDNLDYFREDISLNSYYYGVHIKYPFWMSNDELLAIDSKYTENIYYIHQQLLARYYLEKEHIKRRNFSSDLKCLKHFNPYLSYDNGTPFPSRSSIRAEWNDEFTRIKAIDIAIKECISRGLIFMDNGAKVDLTEDNYVDLLIKLIRANYESVQIAKSIRALFGNGGNGYPTDRYNPAPSVMHHPQTTLRDPLYWQMLQYLINYFTDFSSTLKPLDFSKYKCEDISIVDGSFSKITTYFEYYQIVLNNIFNEPKERDKIKAHLIYTARKRRLTHSPVSMTFTVDSKVNKTCIVKLFLGPQCHGVNCWDNYLRFYELDFFTHNFEQGLNTIEWSSQSTTRYSFDEFYNFEITSPRSNRFNTYQMPQNLMIPQGLKEGLNLTLCIFILPTNEEDTTRFSEPLGFPFHRQILINSTDASNYKFYNISIYHKENSSNGISNIVDYFSPHLN